MFYKTPQIDNNISQALTLGVVHLEFILFSILEYK